LSTTSFRVFLAYLLVSMPSTSKVTHFPDYHYPFTGSMVALHCGKDHVQSQRESVNFDLAWHQNPWYFFKVELDDHDNGPRSTLMQIFILIRLAGASFQILRHVHTTAIYFSVPFLLCFYS